MQTNHSFGSVTSVIVCGRPGCGKTRDAMKIRNHFGLTWIIDNWEARTGIVSNDRLYLSNLPMSELRRKHRRAMIIDHADIMAQIEALK